MVLIAQAASVSGTLTMSCSAIYFFARPVHAVTHISGCGLFFARTVIFTVGWLAFTTYAIMVLRTLW